MVCYGRESGISTEGNEENEGGSESAQEDKKLAESSTERDEGRGPIVAWASCPCRRGRSGHERGGTQQRALISLDLLVPGIAPRCLCTHVSTDFVSARHG